MLSLFVLWAGLSGDPVVDSYPPDVIEACRTYWSTTVANKKRGGTPEVMRYYDEQIRSGIQACLAIKEQQRQHEDAMSTSRNAAMKQVADMRAAEQARRDAQRKEQEDRTRAREEERDTVSALNEQRLQDPKWMRPLWSARLCMATQERKWAMAEVTKERKLAKEVGVINLETLRQYQNTIRDDDETIAESRKELAAMKAKPIACSNAVVAEIAECLPVYTPRSESLTPEECRTGQVLEYLRLTRDPRD